MITWKEIGRQRDGKVEVITMQAEWKGEELINTIVQTRNFNGTLAQSNSVVVKVEQRTKPRISKKE
jgi:hypothetical protein